MDCIEILGGNPLHGEIKIQGSKNAALPIIAGTILNKGISVLHNCPKIIDVLYMVQILEMLGCRVRWEGHSLIIDAACIDSCEIPGEFTTKMRSSIILLGSLLGRLEEARLSYPGGCVIGARPIDLHLSALKKMNVSIWEEDSLLTAKSSGICGSSICLPFPSVGATENVILAAVLARGSTRIRGCAREPEIVELCGFLNCMGARISGAGTGEICIRGVQSLHDIEYEIVSDRIVAGTYMLAVVSAGGCVYFENPPDRHLYALECLIRRMGHSCERYGKGLCIKAVGATCPIPYTETMPYPGFPTDLQSQLMAVLTTARGSSHIKESIFEARFKVADQLCKMGADIQLFQNVAQIHGVDSLTGMQVTAEELRGGAALVIAGLSANGLTTIKQKHFIDRGYEDICGDLQCLGADITC